MENIENELSLGELFAISDKIGNKYLSDEEIESRKAEYDEIVKDIIALDAER